MATRISPGKFPPAFQNKSKGRPPHKGTVIFIGPAPAVNVVPIVATTIPF